jgi:hypothetical protein
MENIRRTSAASVTRKPQRAAVSLGRYSEHLHAPVQVVGSWSIAEGNLGYTPYNSSNPGDTSNLGTVTSIGLSGGTTGMTFLLPLQVVE